MNDEGNAILADTGTGRIDAPSAGTAGAALVELHGDIDLEVAAQLRDRILSHVERDTDVLVDLSDVTLIDGVSLAALIYAGRMAAHRGRKLCLVAPSPVVRRTLSYAGLGGAFAEFPDVRQALGHVSAERRIAV